MVVCDDVCMQLDALSRSKGVKLDVTMGLHTGTVVAGVIGKDAHIVMEERLLSGTSFSAFYIILAGEFEVRVDLYFFE